PASYRGAVITSPRYHPVWAPAYEAWATALGGLAPATPARPNKSTRPFPRAAQRRVRDTFCAGLAATAGSLEQNSRSVLLPINALSVFSCRRNHTPEPQTYQPFGGRYHRDSPFQ